MGSYSASVAIQDEVTETGVCRLSRWVRSDATDLAPVFAGGGGGGDRSGFASAGGFDEDCDSAWKLVAGSLLDLYVEALDLLVESGERDPEVFGGFGLVPVAALETVGDDAALDLLHQVEEGGVGLVVEQAGGVGVAGELSGQQVGRDGAGWWRGRRRAPWRFRARGRCRATRSPSGCAGLRGRGRARLVPFSSA